MNTEFENYAREQLDGHEIQVDVEALWTNVYPHVKKEKGNRYLTWFFLFGLFAFAGTISLFIYHQNRPADEKGLAEITVTNHNLVQHKLENQTASLSLDRTKNISSNPFFETINNFTEVKNTVSNPVNINTISNNKNKSTIGATSRLKTSSLAANSIDQNTKENMIVVDSKTTNSIEKISKTTSKKNKNDKVATPSLGGKASTADLLLTNNLNPNPINQYNELTAIEYQEEEEEEEEEEKLLETDKKEQNRRRKFSKNLRFGFGVYGGISGSTTSFSGDDSIGISYAIGRNTSEERLETLHLGVDVSIYSGDHFYLRSGVEYTRIGSVFSENSTLVTTDSIEGIKEIVTNTFTGAVDTIFGQVAVTTTTEFIKKQLSLIHI